MGLRSLVLAGALISSACTVEEPNPIPVEYIQADTSPVKYSDADREKMRDLEYYLINNTSWGARFKLIRDSVHDHVDEVFKDFDERPTLLGMYIHRKGDLPDTIQIRNFFPEKWEDSYEEGGNVIVYSEAATRFHEYIHFLVRHLRNNDYFFYPMEDARGQAAQDYLEVLRDNPLINEDSAKVIKYFGQSLASEVLAYMIANNYENPRSHIQTSYSHATTVEPAHIDDLVNNIKTLYAVGYGDLEVIDIVSKCSDSYHQSHGYIELNVFISELELPDDIEERRIYVEERRKSELKELYGKARESLKTLWIEPVIELAGVRE